MKSKLAPFLFFVVGLLVFLVSGADAQNISNEIIKRMDAYNNNLAALTAELKLTKVNKQLGDVTEIDYGSLKYVPDKKSKNEKKPYMRIDFRKPERSISIRNGKYYMYQTGSNQAYIGPTSSVKGRTGGGGPLSFLAMTREELKTNFSFEYLREEVVQNSKKELTWHLRLTPKGVANYQYAEIWVTKDGLPVQTMIVEKNGDSSTILLTTHNDRAKIDLSTMAIQIPKTVTIHEEK